MYFVYLKEKSGKRGKVKKKNDYLGGWQMINRKDNEKKKRRHGRGPRSIMGKDGVARAPSIFVVIITTVALFFF